MSETLLHKDDRGILRISGNETILEDVTSSGDPVAYRLRSKNETVGKISVDVPVGSGWKEVGYVGFKRDERGRTDPAHEGALEVEFWSHIPGQAYEDPNYERIFAIRHDGVVFYKGGASGAAANFLESINGQHVTVHQNDGNLVTYDTTRGPVGDANAAIWSSQTGPIG